MSNPTHEFRTLGRLVLTLSALVAASSRVEAQQYYYLPASNPAPAAAPTYTYVTQPATTAPAAAPTYTYAAQPATTAGAVQYYQTAPQTQYVQPTQYYQSAYEGMNVVAQPVQTQVVDAVQPVQTQAAAPAPAATGGDAYGFTAWLNGIRASYGLGAVGYDPNLESWAAMNNSQQAARGLGHHVMGPARRQNSAMGSFPGVESMWMASPAHRAALLDPTITWIGIAGAGAWWTFNAY